MPEINELTALDTLTGGDQFPVYSQANGDARKVAASVLLAYLFEQLASAGDLLTQYAAPNASGFSATINPSEDGQSVYLLLTPAAAYAVGTVVLPPLADCAPGQEIIVTSTQAVTALTVNGNGATVNGAPAALTANGFFKLRFDGVFNAWFRIG